MERLKNGHRTVRKKWSKNGYATLEDHVQARNLAQLSSCTRTVVSSGPAMVTLG